MNRAPVRADVMIEACWRDLKGLLKEITLKGCRFPSEFWSSICYRPLNCSPPCKFPAGWRTHHHHHQNWTLCIILNSWVLTPAFLAPGSSPCRISCHQGGRGRGFGKCHTGATAHKVAYRERQRESTAFREYIYNSAHFLDENTRYTIQNTQYKTLSTPSKQNTK